jgi:hypothetical protein
MNKRAKVSKGEIFILAVIIAAAAILFAVFRFPQSGVNTAWINYGGESLPVSLDENRIYYLNKMFALSPEMTFEVRGGQIAVISSDCPGGDCVHSGFIPERGRVIICVPNRVTVTVNDENIMYDAVI